MRERNYIVPPVDIYENDEKENEGGEIELPDD